MQILKLTNLMEFMIALQKNSTWYACLLLRECFLKLNVVIHVIPYKAINVNFSNKKFTLMGNRRTCPSNMLNQKKLDMRELLRI